MTRPDSASAADQYRLLQARTFLKALEKYRRKHPEPEGEESAEHAAWERGAEVAVAGALRNLKRATEGKTRTAKKGGA